MSEQDKQFLIEGITTDVVLMLMCDYRMTMDEALDELYTSDTFKKLEDPETGLYYQSSLYVYSFLKAELQTGHLQ